MEDIAIIKTLSMLSQETGVRRFLRHCTMYCKTVYFRSLILRDYLKSYFAFDNSMTNQAIFAQIVRNVAPWIRRTGQRIRLLSTDAL
uniref:Transposase n=1 Tax=Romanomermis culicivorax TaxID=13658 RepID=A0A915LB29_ROMCU